ncbi:MAG: SDR family NAD(P)-dependent oxidoreductase [Flaviflexus sp.]|uniref:SDR family NAD(P)-dependent oxidoreductase n=1 Tax=Flaviflexus sp. TaxID=1969482 RepID=UPI003F92D788
MDLQLEGKRVLVTGGASGLGAELVRSLAAEGARVALNFRSREDDARAMAESIDGEVVPIHADLSDRSQTRGLFEQAVDALGGLDILVNNAGLWLTTEVGVFDDDLWDRSLEVNLGAPMLLSQLFIAHCTGEGRKGRILNITSQAAFRGSSTGHVPYAAAKGAIVTMTRSLAREMGGNGVTVNALAIGTMESPMIADALEQKREFYEARIPIGYVATADQIASVATFLVSEKSSYMTGATVDVSGGQLLH